VARRKAMGKAVAAKPTAHILFDSEV
jgi:hypothetical protein